MAKWQLFEPFEKLKNYMGNRRMISSDDIFFVESIMVWDENRKIGVRLEVKTFFFLENRNLRMISSEDFF